MNGTLWIKPRIQRSADFYGAEFWEAFCPYCFRGMRSTGRTESRVAAVHRLADHYRDAHGGDGMVTDCDCARCEEIRGTKRIE